MSISTYNLRKKTALRAAYYPSMTSWSTLLPHRSSSAMLQLLHFLKKRWKGYYGMEIHITNLSKT
jgi:hypothetical protein